MARFPRSVYDRGTEPDVRFSLANERTLLAYQRTAIGLIGASVAVAHFLDDGLLALSLAGRVIALGFAALPGLALLGLALLVLILRAVAAVSLLVLALRVLVPIFCLRLAGGLIPLLPLLAALRLAALVLCRGAAALRSALHVAALLLTIRPGGTTLTLCVRHVLGRGESHSDQHCGRGCQ